MTAVRAVAECEGVGAAPGSAEGCSLGMGGAGLGGRGLVRVEVGAERGRSDTGSMVWVPGYPSSTSGSKSEERFLKYNVYSTCTRSTCNTLMEVPYIF